MRLASRLSLIGLVLLFLDVVCGSCVAVISVDVVWLAFAVVLLFDVAPGNLRNLFWSVFAFRSEFAP